MVDSAHRTVETKNSTAPDFHEGRERERKKEPRGKTRPQARPKGPKRENDSGRKSVENGKSSMISTNSTVLSASELEVETPGRLTQAQIRAIQKDYVNGFTPAQIEMVTGVRRSTIYKHIQGLEQRLPPAEENDASNSTNVNTTNPSAAVPSAWSVSQPIVAAQPPKVVDLSPSTEERQASSSEQTGDGYDSTQYKPQSRLPLPIVDQQS